MTGLVSENTQLASAMPPTTRNRVLDAALDLFSETGFDAVSMRQIARAVGITQSSIYNHFAGKAEILRALMKESGPHRAAKRLKSLEFRSLSGDPAGFCRAYAFDHLESWFDPFEQKIIRLITIERKRLSIENDVFNDGLFVRETTAVISYFENFAAAGLLDISDPKETAKLFMAGLTYIRLEHLIMPSRPSSRHAVDAAVSNQVEAFIQLVTHKSSDE